MEINVDIMRKEIYAYKNEKTNASFALPYRVYFPSDYSAESPKTYPLFFSSTVTENAERTTNSRFACLAKSIDSSI